MGPTGSSSGIHPRDRVVVEADVGFVGLERPGKAADGGGVEEGDSRIQEGRIKIINFELLVDQGGLQVFQGGIHVRIDRAGESFAAHMTDDAGVIVGVNLLGASGGAEEAGDSVKTFQIRLDGERLAGRMGLHLLFEGSREVSEDGLVSNRAHG